MIRNLIFDMGNVLIKYDPRHFVERLGLPDPADSELLLREIFQSSDWPLIDSGDVDEAGLLARVAPRIPERLHWAAEKLIFSWNEPIEPIPGMADFIRARKAAGCGVYLLSNASVRQGQYWPQVPGSECFDGRMVSAEVRCVKPDLEIFRRLLDTFGLNAEECLFIDDVMENVEGARRAGLRAAQFTGDLEALKAELRSQGMEL